MNMLVLNHDEVIRLLPVDECIPVMRQALTALARGEAYQPLRMVIRPPEARGMMALMPSFLAGERPALAVKVICIFHGNPAVGKDAHQGVVLLFSPETGEPVALFNASAITAIRTAAVSGVATQLLAREDAGELAIVGTGVQARSHLAAMAHVRQIRRARIASRHPDHTRAFVKEMQPRYGFPILAVDEVERAVRDADLIVTATTALEPIVSRDWISPGAHLNVVGASTPNAREVDGATMAAATLFTDRRESLVNEAGDYLLAMSEGAIGPGRIATELGELLAEARQGRTSPAEITLFKSLGLAVEDLASAQYLYEKAAQLRAGTRVEF